MSNERFLTRCAGLLVITTFLGCASSPEPAEEPYTPIQVQDEESIGYFLANFDKSLRRWTELKLNARSDADQRTLRALDTNLRKRAIERQEELVAELETGPPTNREVAAVALGFTGDPGVLSPLLAALSDSRAAVARQSLLGLGVLGLAETPTANVIYLLETSPDPWTRNNAAFALQRIVAAGGEAPDLAVACRTALVDEEPGVRVQCASVLGMLGDTDSIPYLGDLLSDEVNLVVRAAAAALSEIGRERAESKGTIARLLVEALEEVDSRVRNSVLLELSRLAGHTYGEDVAAWREWAYKLP